MEMDFRCGKEINCVEDYPMTRPNPTCTKSDFNWPVGFGKDRNITVYGRTVERRRHTTI